MIEPLLADDALLQDVAASREAGGFSLWWLGQSGFLIQWAGQHLLLDPYLSDSLTKKYAATDKPHVRMTRQAIDPARLDFLNVVTSSHNHTDHLDGETLAPLLKANPAMAIVVPAANRDFAAQRIAVSADRLTTIDDGGSVSAAGFTIHAVPSAHETIDRDAQRRCHFLGYVVEFGPYAIYHSGDTILWDGLATRLRHWRIDLALLPINGRGPERRVAGNLWGAEAAALARAIGAKIVVPCHYDMFEFNTASPEEFVANCQARGQGYRVLQCGERLSWSG